MDFFDFFDATFVINLRHRSDRFRTVQAELTKHGCEFPSDRVCPFWAVRPDEKGSFDTVGYRGAFLSHLGVLQEAHSRKLNNVLILEDDVKFADDLVRLERSLIFELKNRDWDIVQFGYESQHQLFQDDNACLFPYDDDLIGLHFYAVNGPAIPILIEFFELLLSRPTGHPDGGPMSPDGALNLCSRMSFKRLIASPLLGTQRSSRSDCRGDLERFDRLPVVRHLATLVRQSGLLALSRRLLKRSSDS